VIVKRQAVHWRDRNGHPACHIPTLTLLVRTTRDPALVRCERCLVLLPKFLAMARDEDSLTLPEV
jgi:hypothetical protein